ncbi:MAG: efflux RND transporter periplasmic adaptor subunit [Pseudomonadaceae bacterium]|nr:efflux RND transporter periplasmic adaptor subunit [Pseudomonadaceae bacterium]
MIRTFKPVFYALLILSFSQGCTDASHHSEHVDAHGHEHEQEEMPRGPHGGRYLTNNNFAMELSIYETGVPPEFRVWAYHNNQPVAPREVDLKITLTRLGGIQDHISFAPQEDYLRGDTTVYEPHSFVVTIEARHAGETHRWTYDNFEGRTRISPEMAQKFGLETELAGAATITETTTVYGRVLANQELVRVVSARFEGAVQSVEVAVGDQVQKGQSLARVESNQSLQSYTINAPISGVVSQRNVNPGEQTAGRTLFTIMDSSSVWVDLAVFPADRARVHAGTAARVTDVKGNVSRKGEITLLSTVAEPNQSVTARLVLDNQDGAFVPGVFVKGELEVAEHVVPLAVKRSALQSFRDFTVVFAQIEDEYEVRMLELGRQDDTWIEVLGGIEPGTRYVTTNSYLIKADIEKAGAVHDH